MGSLSKAPSVQSLVLPPVPTCWVINTIFIVHIHFLSLDPGHCLLSTPNQINSEGRRLQSLSEEACWTYSHHCQIADKNPSKRWNGEFWGFRICIGFGLAVPPLPHIVFRVCLYNGFLCCWYLCARLMSVSFPATTPRATTPHRYLTATTPRATTPVQIHSS